MRKSQQKHLEEALRACASSLPDDGPCDGVEENEAESREAAPQWPAQLEGFRVPDDVCAAAYEASLPQCRAAIKTGLALGMAHYEQERPSGGHCRRERRDARLGYWQSSGRHPAPWAILAFSPSYAAAARLAAVALCAQLAEIPLLGAVCVGGIPSGPVLTALELCGVEDIFCMDPADLCALLEELPAPGRLALLHAGELDGIAAAARVLALRTFEERGAPTLAVQRPELFDEAVLRFCHGDAAVERALLPGAGRPEAIFTADASARVHSKVRDGGPFRSGAVPLGRLSLSPGCEGLWLHADLSPDFFSVFRHGFGLLPRKA